MDTIRSNKLVWLIFLAFLSILLIKEYTRIADNLMNFTRFTSWLPRASTSTTVSPTTLQNTTAFPMLRKNVYLKFMGRFGNVIFEFAGAYSMVLAAGCQKMFFLNNGQAQRLKMFFPKMKDLLNEVPSFPPGLKYVHELHCNKYHPKTTREVAQSKTDVRLDGFLGESIFLSIIKVRSHPKKLGLFRLMQKYGLLNSFSLVSLCQFQVLTVLSDMQFSSANTLQTHCSTFTCKFPAFGSASTPYVAPHALLTHRLVFDHFTQIISIESINTQFRCIRYFFSQLVCFKNSKA